MTGTPAAHTVTDFGIPAVTEAEVSVEHARRVAAVLDSPAPIRTGGPLPLLWHWAFGTPETPTARLGPDGHPRLPEGGPSAGLTRRMWAGGRVVAHRPVTVGLPFVRSSSLLSAERKTGRTGDLLIVTVGHRYEQDGEPVITEEQDLVYRAPGDAVPEPVGDHAEPAAPGGWADRVVTGPVTLFRFSAVTFNAHRIHYDAAYAAEVEGYPRPVVHGPLSAMLLAESVRSHAGRELAEFSFRASAPLFAGLPFTLTGTPDRAAGPDGAAEAGAVDLRVIRNDGRTAMTATARLREPPA